MFILSKLLHFLLHPMHLLLALLLAGLVLGALGLRRGARALYWLAAALVLVVGATPLGDALGYWLENRIAPGAYEIDRVAGAIVLGGPISRPVRDLPHNRYALGGAVERLTAIVSLRRERADLPVIFTGGDASILANGEPEAKFARLFLADIGVDPDSILFESRARNTHENAVYAAEMIDARADLSRERPWLLVTSAAHMPRAVGTFRRAGLNVIPLPVDYGARPPSWSALRLNPAGRFGRTAGGLSEIVGMLYYRALDRSDAWLPDD